MKRFLVAVAGLTFATLAAAAQDPGMMAAQQAQQAAQQASDDAMRANQQAMRDAQNAAAMNTGPGLAASPRFSLKPAAYSTPLRLFLTDSTRHATIYYTTNGWAPTMRSRRYTGPITIARTERVQAIAVAPGYLRSRISAADYTLPGTVAGPQSVAAPDGVLRSGTRIPLLFATAVSSSTARVGDPIALRLAGSLDVAGRTIAGSAVQAAGVVTAVHKPAAGGQPGEVTFMLNSVTADGVNIPVFAEETAEGRDHFDKARGLVLIPGIGLSALAVHGEQAEIKPDTPVVATVIQDTRLP